MNTELPEVQSCVHVHWKTQIYLKTSMETATTTKSFVVMYLGSSVLDRRYPPQYVMPWVMAEVKRRKESFKEVNLKVLPHILQATLIDHESVETQVLFEHKLICLSKFAKTHQDPRCFSYLSRPNLYCDYECHVFLAHSEETVSIILKFKVCNVCI